MQKYLYIKHTNDKYELPILVTDSVKEMSEKTGRTRSSISTMVSRRIHGYTKVPFNTKGED